MMVVPRDRPSLGRHNNVGYYSVRRLLLKSFDWYESEGAADCVIIERTRRLMEVF